MHDRGLHSQIESDEHNLSQLTPNNMSILTPNAQVQHPETNRKDNDATTVSGMDTMNQTLTPLGDNKMEKASMITS